MCGKTIDRTIEFDMIESIESKRNLGDKMTSRVDELQFVGHVNLNQSMTVVQLMIELAHHASQFNDKASQ